MGKIGAYEYPEIGLTEAKGIAKTIEDRFNKEIQIEPLATLLGHKSVESGGFRAKVTALDRWGLSDGRRLTKLADNLLHPMEGEEWKWVLECIKKVTLFWELLKRNPETIPSEKFWQELVAIASVDRSEAEKKAGSVRRSYEDAYGYLSRVKPAEMGIKELIAGIIPPTPPEKKIAPPPIGAPAPVIEIRAESLGLSQTFPLTPEGIMLAKPYLSETMINFLNSQIRKREEAEIKAEGEG